MDKNCLSCKYEPDWGGYIISTEKCYGTCKWDGKIPKMPQTYMLAIKSIERLSDDSGIMTKCSCWKPKCA